MKKGRVFVVESEADVERLASARGVTAVSVAHGFRGDPTLPWLAEQRPLESLLFFGSCDLGAAIGRYRHAEGVRELQAGAYAYGVIPWERLAAVTTLMLTGTEHQERWLRGAPPTLVELEVKDYEPADLTVLSRLADLTSLTLGTRRRLGSLRGLEHLTRLRLLDVQATSALRDFADLPQSLQVLGLTGCRGLQSLDVVARSAPLLQRLWLDNCGQIESLQPLRGLPDLQSLELIGETVVLDGALQHVVDRLGTGAVQFVPRRHYDVQPQRR